MKLRVCLITEGGVKNSSDCTPVVGCDVCAEAECAVLRAVLLFSPHTELFGVSALFSLSTLHLRVLSFTSLRKIEATGRFYLKTTKKKTTDAAG